MSTPELYLLLAFFGYRVVRGIAALITLLLVKEE